MTAQQQQGQQQEQGQQEGQGQQQQQQHTPSQSQYASTPNIRSLPVLLPRPMPHQPIRSIDASTFADVHLAHITSDVPDSVLFPFLHGLEGDNFAQNSFFAASSGLDLGTRRPPSSTPDASSAEEAEGASWGAYPPRSALHNVVKVPEYRGLIWVACDDDERQADTRTRTHGQGQDVEFDDDEDFEFEYDEYEQDESEDGELMDVDESEGKAYATCSSHDLGPTAQEGTHMHPQALRKPATAPIAITTGSHHSSYFTSAQDTSHHHTGNGNVHLASHTIRFPSSVSSPASLDIPQEDASYDRRLSTSSVTTSESTSSSSSSTSTSASDSAHSNFGFGTSASYSTTASSVGHIKDLGVQPDSCNSEADSDSPTAYSPAETGSSTVLTTPCTSPCTDISIDECIPAVSAASVSPLHSQNVEGPATNATLKPTSDVQCNSLDSSLCLDENPVAESKIEGALKRLTVTSSFRANDLLTTDPQDGGYMFLPPKVPDGISLRNFGIQVPIYATLSDIVIFSTSASPNATRAALSLAEKFKIAIERKAAERKKRYEDAGVEVIWIRHSGYGQVTADDEQDAVRVINYCKDSTASRSGSSDGRVSPLLSRESSSSSASSNTGSSNGVTNKGDRPRAYLVAYNVFVLTDSLHVLAQKAPWLVNRLPEPGTMYYDEESVFTSTGVYPVEGVTKLDDTSNSTGSSYNRHEASNETSVTSPTSSPSLSGNKNVINIHDTILPVIDFAQRERDEMRDLTKATAILENLVYLGNVSDVPVPVPTYKKKRTTRGEKEKSSIKLLSGVSARYEEKDHYENDERQGENNQLEDGEWDAQDEDKNDVTMEGVDEDDEDPFDSSDNPMGYDVCIECRDPAPLPSADQIRAAETHLAALDALWSAKRYKEENEDGEDGHRGSTIPRKRRTSRGGGRRPRPPPSASHIVHFTFPASPPGYAYTMWQLTPFLNFLSGILAPVQNPPSTRPKKILIYSSDGYTESSILALCVLMKERGLDLPGAYLEMQVEKERSFFVYHTDVGVLKRVESQLEKERAAIGGVRGGAAYASYSTAPLNLTRVDRGHASWNSRAQQQQWSHFDQNWEWERETHTQSHTRETGASHPYARSPRNSISYPMSSVSPLSGGSYGYNGNGHDSTSAPPVIVPSQGHGEFSVPAPSSQIPMQLVPPTVPHRRPRAQTSPNLPPHIDHQTWFNDPRFDGSFPSRVLPFLYLGNLNHAQNAYMLHALGITHVVSVGECALVPPANIASDSSSGGYHLVAGRGPGGMGSLWMEEREGRIKVLDIKGVCDDGIDSLQHQLEPICDWIEKARLEGGKVLVHCRVGVSRSATVTIAYVMKHLEMPLVDAYLIVRSRRLNVLIQPNMRLLYNLCGWEVELARKRAGLPVKGNVGVNGNADGGESAINRLRKELAQSLNWPYLAREVHRLNEKYLH